MPADPERPAPQSGRPTHGGDGVARMDPERLRSHVLGSYFSLRWGLAGVAILFPLTLPVLAKLVYDIPLQGSLSAYYHAGDGAVRNLFVGVLVAVGAVLYIYKGFSDAENNALNLAGLFVVGVAMIPMQWGCGAECARFSPHGLAAVLFFGCIAYVAWRRAKDTLELLRDPTKISRYKMLYRLFGIALAASPLAAVVVNALVQRPGQQSSTVFFIEAIATLAFGFYWAVKSLELGESCAELLSLQEEAVRTKVQTKAGKVEDAIVRTDEVGVSHSR